MIKLRYLACMAASAALVPDIAVAQAIDRQADANEAVTVTRKHPGARTAREGMAAHAALFSAPGEAAPTEPLVDTSAEAMATSGPEARRVLHEDELLFHDLHADDHDVRMKPDWMAAHFIDVGQGNATVLEFSCGAMLIDTGGQNSDAIKGNAQLTAYLDAFFKRRSDLARTLALVVLTHPHADHTDGIVATATGAAKKPGIIDATGASPYRILNIVTNAQTTGSGIAGQSRLLAYGDAKRVPVTVVRNADIQRAGGMTSASIDPLNCSGSEPRVRLLWGSEVPVHPWSKEANNHSVVVRVDFGESSFLFTGDLEENAQPELIRSYALNPSILDIDVYQVGHHGSRNGTTLQLMKATSPEIAVIGAGNPADEEEGWTAYSYAHPNQVAIKALSHQTYGVTMTRAAELFPVGIKGRAKEPPAPPQYEYQEIDRAIYATGWDGNIVITASLDGKKAVHID